jgi:hypothetical protein
MVKLDLGIKLAKEIASCVKTGGKNLLATKPAEINFSTLKFTPQLETDVLKLSKDVPKMSPEAIIDHGSLVMQTRISKFTKDVETGIEYANVTRDDILLAHSVPNSDAINSLTYLLQQNAKCEKMYLSSSIVNKNSSMFNGDSAYGVILKNRSANVTTAGHGQVSNFHKTYEKFLQDLNYTNLGETSRYVLVKLNTLENLEKSGIKLSNFEYIELFNRLKQLEYFDQIPKEIPVGNRILKGDVVRDAIERANIDLASRFLNNNTICADLKTGFSGGFNNEITSLVDGVEALFARVDTLSEVDSQIIKLAKQYKSKIILLGKPAQAKQFEDIEGYRSEMEEAKKIPLTRIKELFNRQAEIRQKYQSILDECNKDLFAQTTKELQSSTVA